MLGEIAIGLPAEGAVPPKASVSSGSRGFGDGLGDGSACNGLYTG